MILGVDFGDSRTGYAVSDALGLFASTYETYAEKDMRRVAEHTVQIAEKTGAEKNRAWISKEYERHSG